jgi:hypothetical protein
MRLLLIIAAGLILTSCATNKHLTSSTNAVEIQNLNYFTPLSYIQYIEKGNKALLSDSLSGLTSYKLDSLLQEKKEAFRLSEEIRFSNDTVKQKFERELAYLVRVINQRKKLNGIPLTPTIASVVKNSNQRFALATVATGFGRRKGNYRGQVAKGAAIGILTLGMAIPTPVKSNITLYAFIFDGEKNEIAYYKRSMPVEKEPTDGKVIDKQLKGILQGYLNEKK